MRCLLPVLSVGLIVCLAGCAGADRSAAHDELQRLEAENAGLRRALAFQTMQQMKELGLLVHLYAEEHGRFPGKPSDLRQLLQKKGRGPSMLVAPYEAARSRPHPAFESEDAVWAWLDEHGSFLFRSAAWDADPQEVVIEERRPVLKDHRAKVFVDGHVELVAEPG